MKVQNSRLFLTINMAVIFGLNFTVKAEVVTSLDPAFTNAVATFVGSIENMGFSTTRFSQGGNSIEENGTTKIIYGVNLYFEKDKNKGFSATIKYSETEFYAANTYTNFLIGVLSSGRLPPVNITYQTDFVVLSHYDSGITTKNASVVLISTNLVADISTTSGTGDSSQDMIQVIKKVEAMRDAMNK
ncbi:MAG: hypothetical protein FWH21_00295 [Kiritimatiellaeota bacterium]|nr:hypothetical protein [Kiritimatiellota bacterium]